MDSIMCEVVFSSDDVGNLCQTVFFGAHLQQVINFGVGVNVGVGE